MCFRIFERKHVPSSIVSAFSTPSEISLKVMSDCVWLRMLNTIPGQ